MPIYLAHGFRWPREGFTGIRVHAVVHNLEDCSVEYIQNDNSRTELLKSFRKAFPDIMKELESPLLLLHHPASPGQRSAPTTHHHAATTQRASSIAAAAAAAGGQKRRIDFLEQYDPADELSEHAVSQPYAFVCDRVLMIAGGPDALKYASKLTQNEGGVPNSPSITTPTIGGGNNKQSQAQSQPRKTSTSSLFTNPATASALSINIEDVIADGSGMSNAAWEALADLRDKLADGEKIGWWVVYNGDPDRAFDADSSSDDEEEDNEEDEGYEEGAEEEEKTESSSVATQIRRPASKDAALEQQQQQAHQIAQQVHPTQSSPKAGEVGPAGGRVPPPVAPTLPPPPPPTAAAPQGQAQLQPPRPPLSTTTSASSNTLPTRERGLRIPGISSKSDQQAKSKEQVSEPAKSKEKEKSASLRKKFFGKRG